MTDTSAGTVAPKKRSRAWLWILMLLLLGGLAAAGWWFWPRLQPTLRALPLVGPLIPSPKAAAPITSPTPGGSAPGTDTVVPGSDSGTGTGTGATPSAADLDARAAQLDQQAKDLAAAQAALDKQQAALAGLQRAAAVYRQMKPASAAPILNHLPDDEEIDILLVLPNDQVAAILAATDPARAARLTAKLVARTDSVATP